MPLQLSRTVVQTPQKIFNRLQRHCHEVTDIKCMPIRKKSNEDVVKSLAGDVEVLCLQNVPICADINDIKQPKTLEVIQQVSVDVQKQLHTVLDVIRVVTADRGEGPACQKHTLMEASELLESFIDQDLPVQLLIDLPILQFEARKDVMNICCALLWSGMPKQLESQVLQYLRNHPRIFSVLVKGYENEEVALQYGVVLRSCARHPELMEAFLKTDLIYELLRSARSTCVDVSSDAMYTIREVLMGCKEVSAPWLEANFKRFFTEYNGLLESDEYLLQRQALTLMSTMFLDRSFKKVMLTYISDDSNLKIHMNLLLSPSRVLRFDAFQVFKVFAANPQKPRRVQLILYKNKGGLVKLLEGIQAPRGEDERFTTERRTIVDRLAALAPPAKAAPVLTD